MATVKSLTRQQSIVAFIREFGEVSVEQIQGAFKISEPTVRRDINALMQRGLVIRAHGKITALNQPQGIDDEFDDTTSRCCPEVTDALARVASEAVGESEIVFIGPGAIPFSAATLLSRKPGLVLQICSLRHASFLRHSHTSTVWVLGGKVDPRTGYVTGGFTSDIVRQFHVDTAIVSCTGIDPRMGAILPSTDLALLLKEVLANARKRILAVDSARFNTAKAGNILPFKYFDRIITDRGAAPAVVDDLHRLGLEVQLV